MTIEWLLTLTPSISRSRPWITGGTALLRAPYRRSARFASTIVTAKVEMKAVISKSTPGRPISGRTATCWITTPNTNATTEATTSPGSGPHPKLSNNIHDT